MLTVIGYLAEAQSHGSEVDDDTQMETIFESLSKEFIPFRIIFNQSGKNLTLTKLMKQLQSFESIIKGKSIEANLTETRTSSKPSNGKKRRRLSKKQVIRFHLFLLPVERSKRRKNIYS